MRSQLRVVLLGLCVVLLAGCDRAGDGEAGDATETATAPATDAGDAGSATADPEALHRVADAAEATAEEGTVRFEITMETRGTGGQDGTQSVGADGEEDFVAQQRRLTFHAPGGNVESLVDATDIYIQIPGTEDETWARLELDALVAGDTGFGGPGGLPFRSSQDNLRLLQDAVTRATHGDEEEVRGELTTRYDLTVDL
ncbi:MAG: hypothetical protein GEU74_05215, partial [Nitriliruptorales bacterium]|nr:hypothetical protein [Nitriliruptorales bacterium]